MKTSLTPDTLPGFMKSCLWSYDLDTMDKKRDARLIITQVLNWGDKRQIDWVKKSYSQDHIKNAVLLPSRGVWFRGKLRQWLAYFRAMIDPLDFEAAIIDMTPRIKLPTAVLRRRGVL